MRFEIGDILFVHGQSAISRIIQKVTHSEVNHVGIICDKGRIFETDIQWGKASFRDLQKYETQQIIVLRPTLICPKFYIQTLCEKYNKTPYSFWDICTNLVLSPFPSYLRETLVSFLGTKKYAICSELTARILYEWSNLEYLAGYEGYTPQDLLTILLSHPEHFQVVADQTSQK